MQSGARRYAATGGVWAGKGRIGGRPIRVAHCARRCAVGPLPRAKAQLVEEGGAGQMRRWAGCEPEFTHLDGPQTFPAQQPDPYPSGVWPPSLSQSLGPSLPSLTTTKTAATGWFAGVRVGVEHASSRGNEAVVAKRPGEMAPWRAVGAGREIGAQADGGKGPSTHHGCACLAWPGSGRRERRRGERGWKGKRGGVRNRDQKKGKGKPAEIERWRADNQPMGEADGRTRKRTSIDGSRAAAPAGRGREGRKRDD